MRKRFSFTLCAVIILAAGYSTALAADLVISDISRAGYTPQYNSLAVGQLVYSDRPTITFTNVAALGGSTYIKTKNDDKASSGGDTSFLTFTINQECTVYVAHDTRITTKPAWLSPSFTDTTVNLATTDTTLRLYSKTFAAGSVALGGNGGNSSYSMYSVVVVPNVTTPPSAASNPSPANGATTVSVMTDLNWTAGSGAASHNVYFGTSSPGTYQGNQAGTAFDPGMMTTNKTYYWRIDEVNSYGTTTGTVWTFTTAAIDPTVIYLTSFDGGVDSNWTARAGTLSAYDSDGNASLDALRQTSQYLSFYGDHSMSISMLYAADNPLGSAKGVKLGAAYPGQYTNNYRVTMNGYTQNSPGAIGIAVCANSTFTLVYQYTNDASNYLANNGYFQRMIVYNGTSGVAAGTYFVKATDRIPGFNVTQPHKYEVEVTGDRYTFWVDNVMIIQETSPRMGAYDYASSYYRNGSVGVAAYVGATANNYVVKDFTVQYVDAPAPVRTASNHYPNNNGTVKAANSATLYWTAGAGALSHNVYFGTSQADVSLAGDIDGDGQAAESDLLILANQWLTNPGNLNPSADIEFNGNVDLNDFKVLSAAWNKTSAAVYKGNYTTTSCSVGTLPAGTYYWRVDEVFASTLYKGQTWSFTVGTPPVKIMPLGDSITHGSTSWSNYRSYLYNKLLAGGYTNIDFVGSHNTLAWEAFDPAPDKDNEGHGGWTADGLLYGGGTTAGGTGSINMWLTGLKAIDKVPDIVLVHIGTNDEAYIDPITGDHTVTLNEIKALIDVFRKYNPYVTLLVAKLIPENASYHLGVESLNALIPSSLDGYETSTSKVYIVDHYTGFSTSWLVSGDGVHPNATGANEMSNRWYAVLTPLL